jgi:hypothetical protein
MIQLTDIATATFYNFRLYFLFPRTILPPTHSTVQYNIIGFPQYGLHGYGTFLAQTICRISGANSLIGKGPVRTS